MNLHFGWVFRVKLNYTVLHDLIEVARKYSGDLVHPCDLA